MIMIMIIITNAHLFCSKISLSRFADDFFDTRLKPHLRSETNPKEYSREYSRDPKEYSADPLDEARGQWGDDTRRPRHAYAYR
jgi:hypothetical protein